MVFRISINSLGHKIRNDEELVLNVKLNLLRPPSGKAMVKFSAL